MKKITLARIMQRLKDRFDLDDLTPEEFAVIEKVFLMTDVDELLREPKIASQSRDISGATGHTTYFTVPAGKRWRLHAMSAQGTTGNSNVSIYDGTTRCPIIASGTGATNKELGHPIPLDENWEIQRQNTNNGGDTSRSLTLIYEEEDAY